MQQRDYTRLDADLDTRVVRHRETQATVAMSSAVRPHATPPQRAVQRLNDPADMGTTLAADEALKPAPDPLAWLTSRRFWAGYVVAIVSLLLAGTVRELFR